MSSAGGAEEGKQPPEASFQGSGVKKRKPPTEWECTAVNSYMLGGHSHSQSFIFLKRKPQTEHMFSSMTAPQHRSRGHRSSQLSLQEVPVKQHLPRGQLGAPSEDEHHQPLPVPQAQRAPQGGLRTTPLPKCRVLVSPMPQRSCQEISGTSPLTHAAGKG